MSDWCATLDLRDAYFHMAIFLSPPLCSQTHHQFTVLPFGLSVVPRIFIKCMAVVVAFLRKVQVYPYLNDWLVKGCTRA